MPYITLTKGLPGSGKTTWARQQLRKRRNAVVNICTDDLRRMMFGDAPWPPTSEEIALTARDALLGIAMQQGKHIIVSDTNLDPRHEAHVRHLVREFNARHSEDAAYRLGIKDFTDVDLETCIARDLRSEHPVGERVIRELHARYLRAVEPAPPYDPSLPDCIICDLDGTLAILNGRNPYDASTSDQDLINEPVRRTIMRYADPGACAQPVHLILFSGRHARDREPTERWLARHGIAHTLLVMRATDDNRKDAIIKREFFDAHVRGRYNVLLVIDDRLQVCRMWYEMGLPLMRVGDPDAHF